MGSTPLYGLPYPDDTDLVIQGDDAMEALALAVETELSEIRTRSSITTDTGPAQGFSSAGGVLEFSPGTFSGDWSFDGTGTYTFSGPNTWFLASLRVNIGPNTTGFRSTVVLTVGGSPVQISDFAAAAAGGTDYSRHSHSIVVPMRVQAPQSIQVQVSTSTAPGSEVLVSSRSLRLVSLP